MYDDLRGKVALVTGGGNGQGRSHAIMLARLGADVVISDVADPVPTVEYPMSTAEDLDETQRLVKTEGRGRCHAITADVRSQSDMNRAAAAAVENFGRLDIVVANAGIFTYGQSWELTEEQWSVMLDVDLTGVWRTCKAAIPHMIEAANGGSIILTSSISGLKGYPGQSHYCAAKHGLVGLMRCLAHELAPHSIRVNTLHPSGTATGMTQNSYMEGYLKFAEAAGCDIQNLLDVEMMEPIELSNAVAWMASDASRFVTGSTIPIDAGHLAR